MEPTPGTGLTLLASWLEKHKEQMAARGSGQPLNITIQGVAADLRWGPGHQQQRAHDDCHAGYSMARCSVFAYQD